MCHKIFLPEVCKDNEDNENDNSRNATKYNAHSGSRRAFLYSNCTTVKKTLHHHSHKEHNKVYSEQNELQQFNGQHVNIKLHGIYRKVKFGEIKKQIISHHVQNRSRRFFKNIKTVP